MDLKPGRNTGSGSFGVFTLQDAKMEAAGGVSSLGLRPGFVTSYRNGLPEGLSADIPLFSSPPNGQKSWLLIIQTTTRAVGSEGMI